MNDFTQWQRFANDDGISGVKLDDSHSVGWDLEGWCQDCTRYMMLIAGIPQLLQLAILAHRAVDELGEGKTNMELPPALAAIDSYMGNEIDDDLFNYLMTLI